MELIISIGLISIIALSLSGILLTTKKIENNIINSNQTLNEIKYSLDYILNEIDSADYIENKKLVGIHEKDYIGIILVNLNEHSKDSKYSFTTYIFDKKNLIRLNYKSSLYPKGFYKSDFGGYNYILEKVDHFKSEYSEDDSLLSIEIIKNEIEYNIDHYIRGVIYE